MNKELALKNLEDIKEILDRGNVIYWLDGGTLLGAVRDGNIIPWDGDVDLGMFSSDLYKILTLLSEFKTKMFNVKSAKYYIKLERHNISLDISLNHRYGEYYGISWIRSIGLTSKIIDFIKTILSYKVYNKPRLESILSSIKEYFFSRKSLTKRWILRQEIFAYFLSFPSHSTRQKLLELVSILSEASNFESHHLRFPRHYFEKLESVAFYGMNFNIPSDIEEYFKYRYGENWRIPKKDWNMYRDEGSIVCVTQGISSGFNWE